MPRIIDDTLHVRLVAGMEKILGASLRNLKERGVFNHDETALNHDVELISILQDAIVAAVLRKIRGEKP